MKNMKLLGATVVFLTTTISQAALTPLGGEYPLLGNIAGHQQNPHVAVGPTGGFVVWQNATDDGKGERIAVQRLDGDYNGVGSTLVASQNIAAFNDINPRVSLLPEGNDFVRPRIRSPQPLVTAVSFNGSPVSRVCVSPGGR